MRIKDYEVLKNINDLEEQVEKAVKRRDEFYYKRRNYFINFSIEWKKCKENLIPIEKQIDRRIFCLYYEKLNSLYEKIVKYLLLGKEL